VPLILSGKAPTLKYAAANSAVTFVIRIEVILPFLAIIILLKN
jgi:hypothetical protein